jgi:DNA-binding response OmpR family regulator
MKTENLLDGKTVLIVDDEADVLDTLEDLLPMCNLVRAGDYDTARELLASRPFDLAILDIMGVSGYELLEICVRKKVLAVMLTAYAVTPADVRKSFDKGAAFYIPKEEMADIEVFLNDVLEARQKGRNTWGSWYSRLSRFSESAFGENWMKNEKDLLQHFTFHI